MSIYPLVIYQMDIEQQRDLLLHDRKNKLFAMKLALHIQEDQAYQQLVKQYLAVCRKLIKLKTKGRASWQ